jgi:hypothetical protein
VRLTARAHDSAARAPTSLLARARSRLAWHDRGMARTRISTTVDEQLLRQARGLREHGTDASLIDEALTALLARHRSREIDAGYGAYDDHPLDEPDEWGDLASFRQAAGRS